MEKFQEWTDPAAKLPEDAVDRDQLLTKLSIFWFTGAGESCARAAYEGMQAWRESAHWLEFDRGGHLPAMEVRDLLVGDMRTFLRRLR